MADDSKRINNVCGKVTDQMLVDLNRLCVIQDWTQSEYVYGLIRRDLYGRNMRSDEVERRLTLASDSTQRLPTVDSKT